MPKNPFTYFLIFAVVVVCLCCASLTAVAANNGYRPGSQQQISCYHEVEKYGQFHFIATYDSNTKSLVDIESLPFQASDMVIEKKGGVLVTSLENGMVLEVTNPPQCLP